MISLDLTIRGPEASQCSQTFRRKKGTFTDFLTRRQTFIYNVATLENKLPIQSGKIWNKDGPPQFAKKLLIFTAILNYWRQLWFARNKF